MAGIGRFFLSLAIVAGGVIVHGHLYVVFWDIIHPFLAGIAPMVQHMTVSQGIAIAVCLWFVRFLTQRTDYPELDLMVDLTYRDKEYPEEVGYQKDRHNKIKNMRLAWCFVFWILMPTVLLGIGMLVRSLLQSNVV